MHEIHVKENPIKYFCFIIEVFDFLIVCLPHNSLNTRLLPWVRVLISCMSRLLGSNVDKLSKF